jgi:hypothetical protein
MGYDSLRIELRYRHIWQTKWAAAATTEDGSSAAGIGGVAGGAGGSAAGSNTTSNLQPPQQSSQSRGRRSTSLNRNVHYETELDPGVDSPIGNKQPPTSSATGHPANSASSGGSATRGRNRNSYRHYK